MRRLAKPTLVAISAGLLSGCTGFGVFLDHTTQWFERNPNVPAGSSETFLTIRGEKVDVEPLLPESGNVWPDNSKPDTTLQDIQRQQAAELKKNGGVPPAASGSLGLPPPQIPPPPNARRGSTVQTPGGPSIDVTGGGPRAGYRQLQSGQQPAGAGTSRANGSILVPNGNGTSTLIGPDGSVQTVPTKP